MENSNRIDYDSLIEQISEFLSNYTQIRYGELVGAPWPYNHDGPLVYEEPEAILLDNSMEAIKELRKEIEKLNKEIADREQCSIDQHAEIHEYRDEIHEIEKKLTKIAVERDAVVKDLEELMRIINKPDESSKDCVISEKNYTECVKDMCCSRLESKDLPIDVICPVCGSKRKIMLRNTGVTINEWKL